MSSDGQEAEVQIPIPELLEAMLERGASDLHITVGTPPTIRQYGDLVRLDEYPVLDARGIQGMIYAILPQKLRERLEQELELDMSYSLPGRARFRVNVYYQRDSLGAAFRLIPYEIRTVDDLDLPSVVADLAGTRAGSSWSPVRRVRASRRRSPRWSTSSTASGRRTS